MEKPELKPRTKGYFAIGMSALALAINSGSDQLNYGAEQAFAGTAELEKKPKTINQIALEELTYIHKKIDLLSKEPVKTYFSIKNRHFELKGKTMNQRIISFGDNLPGTFEKTYTHIIEEYWGDSKTPGMVAVVLGSNESRIDEDTDFEYLTILSRSESDKDALTLKHYHKKPNSKQQPTLTRYQINHPQYLIYKSPNKSQKVSDSYMRNVVTNFTSEIDGLLDHILKKNEKQNPLVA